MRALHQLFSPNLVASATIHKYRQGEAFLLIGKTALVMEGLIGVDGFTPGLSDPVTLRLAGKEDILNIEEVIGAEAPEREYVCETPLAVLAVVSTDYFNKQLESTDPMIQNLVSQSLLSTLYNHYQQLTDTAAGLSMRLDKHRMIWALRRIYAHLQQPELPVRKGRLAKHIGAHRGQVSRVLRALQTDLLITRSTLNIVLTEAFHDYEFDTI